MKLLTGETIIKKSRTFLEVLEHRRNSKKDPKSFKEVFGDLSSFYVDQDIYLNSLNLSSMEGFFTKIDGSVYIDDNPELKSLKYINVKNATGNDLYANSCSSLESISDFRMGPDNLRELLIENNPSLSIFEIIIAIAPSRAKFSRFEHVYSDFYQDQLDRAYDLYRKTMFNDEKFKKALELVDIEKSSFIRS